MTPVVIAYGSNLGESMARIASAKVEVASAVTLTADSGPYVSAPMYVEDQEDFFNGVWLGNTALGPISLVEFLKYTEAKLGRTVGDRNGPRLIDLDLIAYGSLVLSSCRSRSLQLPHPRVHERRFVLEPWYAVDPEAVLPGLGPLQELLKNVQHQRLERVAQTSLRQ